MELPKLKSEKGVFDGLKSKLGFADGNGRGGAQDAYYDEYADDYGDEYGDGYDEFAEYGPDYDATYTGTRYDAPDAVTTRAPRTSSRTSRTSASRSSSTSSSSSQDKGFPRLVSIDDVRAHTRVPESLNRDPLPARHVTSASSTTTRRRGERTVVDATAPAPASPAYVAATAAAREAEKSRSEGLESLFSSTATAAAEASQGAHAAPSASSASSSQSHGSYDPYEAYSGTGSAAHNPSRSLSVLMPSAYGDVERVAKVLKAGDAVVLSLRQTPDDLSKRVLDFSFGVASALDARVECIADKVFALTRETSLTDAERTALRSKGVL